MKTISMQDMRYLNLFERVTKVRTQFCFKYNETIFFCVPKPLVSRAIGEGAKNIRHLSETLGRRIKVIAIPEDVTHAKSFIEAIVAPVEFKDLSVTEDTLTITAGSQSKAALLGRNKRRLLEMQQIVSDFFHKECVII